MADDVGAWQDRVEHLRRGDVSAHIVCTVDRWASPLPAGRRVEHADIPACRERSAHDRRADESGAASDEEPHPPTPAGTFADGTLAAMRMWTASLGRSALGS